MGRHKWLEKLSWGLVFVLCFVKTREEDLHKHNVIVKTYFGEVEGLSIPYHDSWIYRGKRVNVFLGIPYARRPSQFENERDFRFRKPEDPRWNGIWDATYYRPACPQSPWLVRQTIPDFHKMDEDCLYLNIFSPNLTSELMFRPDSNPPLNPVMVFIHGGGFIMGSAQQFPAFLLAERNVVVVTMNYRLNALGFLTTNDEVAPGNYGMWDQMKALEFIRNNIKAFRGNPEKITIFGHSSGAASVGLHLISPKTEGLFHQAILMSGSDLSPWAVVSKESSLDYTRQLANRLGCPTNENLRLIRCLQDDRTAMEIANASTWIRTLDGQAGNPWGPVVDGQSVGVSLAFLPDPPKHMRDQRRFKKLRVMGGLVVDEGSFAIPNFIGLHDGVNSNQFDAMLQEFLADHNIKDMIYTRDALKFEYTYHSQPSNTSWVRQMAIDMMSDYIFGNGLDEVLKSQSLLNTTYMYLFQYKSYNDYLPPWRGIAHGQDLQYLFGFPYFTEVHTKLSGVHPRQEYSFGDWEISEFMISTWTNFSRLGYPTPPGMLAKDFRNITWPEFKIVKQTYVVIDNKTELASNYKQQQFAFWKEYFPKISTRSAIKEELKTGKEVSAVYQTATWSLLAVVITLLILIFGMSISMYRFGREKF